MSRSKPRMPKRPWQVITFSGRVVRTFATRTHADRFVSLQGSEWLRVRYRGEP